MNIRETVTIRSPNGKDEECAKFTIDEVARPFTFLGATEENEKYVFSAWVMAEEETTLNIEGKEIPVTTEWKRQKVSYVSSANPLKIYFNKNGVYYFYQSQLEIGDVMTDWAPSPVDIEEAIKSANAKLELKVNKDTLKSEINALAHTFTFTGNGFVVNAKNLTITEDGTIKATNGEFTGTIKGSSGEFTEGFSVILDDGNGYTFCMIMADEGTGLFKVGYDGDEAEGTGLIEVEPGYVGIDGNNVNIGASRGLSMYSGAQMVLDAPEIYIQSSLYEKEPYDLISVLENSVIESGTSGVWYYRKWASGIYECWGRYRSTIIGTNSLLGGSVCYGSVSYPITFIETPVVTYSIYGNSGYEFSGKGSITQNAFTWYALSNATYKVGDVVTVTTQIVGRWK